MPAIKNILEFAQVNCYFSIHSLRFIIWMGEREAQPDKITGTLEIIIISQFHGVFLFGLTQVRYTGSSSIELAYYFNVNTAHIE